MGATAKPGQFGDYLFTLLTRYLRVTWISILREVLRLEGSMMAALDILLLVVEFAAYRPSYSVWQCHRLERRWLLLVQPLNFWGPLGFVLC